MTPSLSKRWLHPQTVPRGFLRLYILTLLSRGPETGYSVMQKIEERTEGAWRPGPGTMYPLLKSLVAEGLAKATGSGGRAGSKTYVLTSKGRHDLDEMRRIISGIGRKERVMSRLFSDLLPGRIFVSMMVNRYREATDTFREKVAEIPRPERDPILKELRLLMESHMQWIDSELAAGRSSGRTPQMAKPVKKP